MKKYPEKRTHVSGEELLVKYTLYPDLKLYEVDSDVFFQYEQYQRLDTPKTVHKTQRFPLNQVKMGTKMTLALEAERVLKNTVVSKKLVRESIREDGHFRPPSVFFRYYGYIELRIRDKPVRLQALEESPGKNVSLFDLFFPYSTPLHIVHDVFYDFMLFSKDHRELQGWVRFNHRNLPMVSITSAEQKNVFMWHADNSLLNTKETTYKELWHQYY